MQHYSIIIKKGAQVLLRGEGKLMAKDTTKAEELCGLLFFPLHENKLQLDDQQH